jgi:hypothetical protein
VFLQGWTSRSRWMFKGKISEETAFDGCETIKKMENAPNRQSYALRSVQGPTVKTIIAFTCGMY